MLGPVRELVPPLAKYMRSGKDGRQFMVQGWKEEHEFEPGTVFHLREADLHQEVYGLPEWISALQSALLNESATLFRRKYYENGSHAGFILYMTDARRTKRMSIHCARRSRIPRGRVISATCSCTRRTAKRTDCRSSRSAR